MPYSNSVAIEPITPVKALKNLKEGNFRFINNLGIYRDHLDHVDETKDEQRPYAAILSCMDSRVPAEIIFDQSIGDIFSIRVAGNVIGSSILGSLEFAAAVSGVKLILVLGHSNCGAIKGACDNVELGHLSSLLQKIAPAIMMEHTIKENRNSSNTAFVQAVTKLNVACSVTEILQRSDVIKELADKGELMLASGIYDVATGRVDFHS